MTVAAPRDTDGVEDRRRQIHVLHQRVARERPGGRQGGGIADDHRHLDGLLPRVVLAGPAMLAVHEAVVGEIDDHRVLRTVAERPEQRSDRVIERARGVSHGRVVLVGRRDLLLGERRPARVQRGRGRHGVGVERRSTRRRHGHARVPGVVGREVRRRRRVHHEERLVRGRVLDEVGRQVLQHIRLVAGLALPDPVDVHHGINRATARRSPGWRRRPNDRTRRADRTASCSCTCRPASCGTRRRGAPSGTSAVSA